MKTWPRRVLSIVTLVILLGSVTPLAAAAEAGEPDLMPPHPRLLEEYEAGRMPMPDFIANPALWHAKGIDSPAERTSLLGSLNALAVVVDFSDKVQTVTATYFDTLIFAAPVVGRGSVRDYYDEVSYGQIDIVTVDLPSSLGVKRAPQTLAYYADYDYPTDSYGYCTREAYPHNCQKLAEDIVDAVNTAVDFSDYDNDGDGTAEPIMLIHAGRGAEYTGDTRDIWSHSWSLSSARNYDDVWISDYVIMPEYWVTVSAATSDMTIGVFAHEMGHGFWGLPDLYDRDYTSYGIGDYSLMAGGSWNGTGPGGNSPAWPEAWDRVQMGILSPTNIATNTTGQTIPQALGNSTGSVIKLDSPTLGAQEYYLLENRQQVSGAYDEYLPSEGLFIWHVDEAMSSYTLWNNNECESQPNHTCSDSAHYLVKLQQADGLLNLENKTNQGDAGDPYPGTSVNRNFTMLTDPESSSYYSSTDTCIGVTNISNSLDTMTANLQVTCVPTFKVYLPLVMRNYVYTEPVLLNGNFESGHSDWTEFSTHEWDVITTSFPGGVTPHGGTWAAWLGGEYMDVSSVAQTVTVPGGTPYLGFWHWIASEDMCGFDFADVYVGATSVDGLDLCSDNDTGGWVHRVVNLSAWSGMSINLKFRVYADDLLNSNWFLDDVAFQASPSPLPIGMHPRDGLWDWVPRLAVGNESSWREPSREY